MKIFAAPLQGFTEAPFRHWHAELYTPADAYFAPFMRVEHSEVRRRDLRDVTSPLNANHRLVPQIIFRDETEFAALVAAVREAGYDRVDLNLGCPFPPQVKRGRGTALVGRPDVLETICRLMEDDASMSYSVKMRPGVTSYDEWRGVLAVLNRMPLHHVTVHPRVAKAQYSGAVDMDTFYEMAAALKHKVVYNGDIVLPSQISELERRCGSLYGVMVGRGLLLRPSIADEWHSGVEWDVSRRHRNLMKLHAKIYEHYRGVLAGDVQVLMKMKPFWQYLEGEMDHKVLKSIKKATSLDAYEKALAVLI